MGSPRPFTKRVGVEFTPTCSPRASEALTASFAAPVAAQTNAASVNRTKPPSAAAVTTPPPRAASPAVAPAAKASAGASKIELAADTIDVPAGQPSAQVTVHRKGSLRGETTFTWWTESGTAKPGADFSAMAPQRAYIADGQANVSLSIPLSIAPHTQSKSFYVVIDQSEGGAPLGDRTLTMVTLLPSD